MPLVKKCSIDAFKENIKISNKEGKPKEQSLAIAFSTLKKACGVDIDKEISPKEIVKKGGKVEDTIRMLEDFLD